MKILVIVGSGKKNGNTDLICDAFIKGATEGGNIIAKHHLGQIEVNGCLGCNACRHGLDCVQNDGMQEIYKDYIDCDMVVLSTPIYYGNISSRLKAFIDRLYAIGKDKRDNISFVKNKTSILLATAADNDLNAYEFLEPYYKYYSKYMGWTDKGSVLAISCGGSPGERKIKNTIYLDEAYKLGKSINC